MLESSILQNHPMEIEMTVVKQNQKTKFKPWNTGLDSPTLSEAPP